MKTQEEEILLAIFEGPVRPLTEEDQKIQDEVDSRYEERKRTRYEGYAEILDLPIEEIERMAKENLTGLIQKVVNKNMMNKRLLQSIYWK